VRLVRHLDHLSDDCRSGAISIGNFDGVHLGHARIIDRLVDQARGVGGPAVVFTFDPHPAAILRPHAVPPPLTWIDRKAELLAELGVDAVIAYPTERSFLELEPEGFFDLVVRKHLRARAMVEGPDFFFGRGRSGNVETLRWLCRQAGLSLDVVEPVQIDGEVVSSSRIRTLVSRGRVEEARHMLTRPYRILGEVIRGAGRGAALGYPTANIGAVRTLLPGEGIYCGRATADGKLWPAALSIGPNPTFGEDALKIEAHLIDYDGNLYGRKLAIDFLARLRDVERFGSADQLIAQMDRDVAACRRIAAAE
jgi:riboflavin kinase/FMN adenylyltransferase